jgi:Zn-dependent protease with chaperone function
MTAARPTFAAYACHASLGDQPATGTISFDGWRLRFESAAVPLAHPMGEGSGERAGLVLEIPLVRLEIELAEGDGDGCVYFRDPQLPDWSLHTFDQNILEQRPLLQQTHTRNQIRAARGRGELKRALKITAAFIAGFALIAMFTSIFMGIMVRSLVAKIPQEWEQELGDKVMQEVSDHEILIRDPKLQAQLDRAVAPLLKVLPPSAPHFKFHLVQNHIPNAFALPGGHVLVHTALIELADRPEELAGVLSHELAHVTLKHGFRKLISAAGPYLVFRLFLRDGSGMLGMLGDSSQLLVRQSFSQAYELEADDAGWQYLLAARIDPRGMTDMLLKLKGIQDNRQAGGLQIEAFSSHPPTFKRIQRLEAKWNRLKDKTGFIDFENPQPGT